MHGHGSRSSKLKECKSKLQEVLHDKIKRNAVLDMMSDNQRTSCMQALEIMSVASLGLVTAFSSHSLLAWNHLGTNF